MACLKKNTNFDIEELYAKRDKDFLLITNDNLHLYEEVVKELFDYMININYILINKNNSLLVIKNR